MKYKGIRFQLLGITLILIGLCMISADKTLLNAILFQSFASIGAVISIIGFLIKN